MYMYGGLFMYFSGNRVWGHVSGDRHHRHNFGRLLFLCLQTSKVRQKNTFLKLTDFHLQYFTYNMH